MTLLRVDLDASIDRRGRYFPIDWVMHLAALLPEPRRVELANAILKPLGLRALTREQAAAEQEAEAKTVLLKAAIVRVIGAEDAQRFFDSIELIESDGPKDAPQARAL